MRKTLLASAIILACGPSMATSLLITEYVEGSSNNKALELTNVSDSTLDLSQYQLKFYFNGNQQAGTSLALSGNLTPGSSFVVADNDASAAILALSDLTFNDSFFNGDDAIELVSQGLVIDSLGQVGVDPGSEWGSGLLSTKDNTLRRDSNASADTDSSDAVDLNGWQGFENDNIDDLGQFNGGGTEPLVCAEPATSIHDIQGTGEASPLVGEQHVIEAVVTQHMPGLKGLFVQASDDDIDQSPLSSEALFVYYGNEPLDYAAGDRIRLQGRVSEFGELTQLTNLSGHLLCATDQALPAAQALSLPLTSLQQPERFESMRVAFAQGLVVNEVYRLGRYGEVTLGSQRHAIGTQVALPGSEALAVTAANALDTLVLDDGLTVQNPDPIRYPYPGLSAENTLRVGDQVTGLRGVMHQAFGAYRIQPDGVVNIVQANPRQFDAPLSRDGTLAVASFNVLNYFNGDGQAGGFPTARGADAIMFNLGDYFTRLPYRSWGGYHTRVYSPTRQNYSCHL
nr:lamin tail domain-containing protein [Shewanella sp. NIFS-20-20]